MTPAQAQTAYSDVLVAFSDGVGAAALAHSAPIARLRSAETAVVGKAILNGTPVSLFEDSISPDPPGTHRTLPTLRIQMPRGWDHRDNRFLHRHDQLGIAQHHRNHQQVQRQRSHVQRRSQHRLV